MKINHKFLRMLALLLVAVVLMTSFAYASDLVGMAEKAKEYAGEFISIVCLIAVLIAAGKMVAKGNLTGAITTGLLGAVLVYFIANPDKMTEVINATIGKIL